jgi:hypothetical protein
MLFLILYQYIAYHRIMLPMMGRLKPYQSSPVSAMAAVQVLYISIVHDTEVIAVAVVSRLFPLVERQYPFSSLLACPLVS